MGDDDDEDDDDDDDDDDEDDDDEQHGLPPLLTHCWLQRSLGIVTIASIKMKTMMISMTMTMMMTMVMIMTMTMNNTDSHLSSITAGFRDHLGLSQSQVFKLS